MEISVFSNLAPVGTGMFGRGGGGLIGTLGLQRREPFRKSSQIVAIFPFSQVSIRRNLGLFAPTSMRFPSKDSKWKYLSFQS